jgi:crotonobetainyl-CoA:carnitine CoA-transferase CaiB-like acyl-CoA transferase
MGPLDDVVVVDLSTGIAGGYCTKILTDAGADVIKVESPEGDELRGWTASGARILPGDDGALFQFLAGGKRSVVLDIASPTDRKHALELTSRADVVVWSAGSSIADYPSLHPHALRELAPAATIAALSAFGLDGPWAGGPATEFTLQAMAGGMGLRGSPERPPVSVGGRMGEWVTGMFAALGVLTSRHRAAVDGIGELLDVSMLESLILTQTMYPTTHVSIAGHSLRSKRSLNFPGVEQTSDGWVGFMVVTGQQWLDFCAMVARPDWMDDETLIVFSNRLVRRAELGPAVSGWMRERTTAEVIEFASSMRIPVAEIGDGRSVPTFEQFVARNWYVRNPRSGFLQPDVPYILSNGAGRRAPGAAPHLGEQSQEVLDASTVAPAAGNRPAFAELRTGKLPFEGMRVADFTGFWAGPIIGHFLAMFGAEVIHIESARRPDGMRSRSVRAMNEDQWWEWACGFHGANTGKLGLTLDMQSATGRALALDLIRHCDVVIDNYTPRVMESWGLGYEQLRAVRPDVVMLRAPGFGLSGPWRERPGFAQTMEQVSGLAWLTGYPDEAPQVPNGPCDPIAGTHATIALLHALAYRRRTGKGMLVESPMVGAALNVAAEQVIEFSAYGTLLERNGNHGPTAVPQNVYPTMDEDRWIAIAIETDEQWERFRSAMGDPEWASSSELCSARARRETEAEIDRHVAAWCARQRPGKIFEHLWAHGVPVAKVLLDSELEEIPQLHARRFFEAVDHPVTGRNTHGGYPVRFSLGPDRLHRRPPPMLGEHNHFVLSTILGLTDAEINELAEQGVIGTRPVGSTVARGTQK